MMGAPFPGSPALTPILLDQQLAGANGSSYTFTGLNFGQPSSNRYLVAVITWSGNGGGNLLSATIGGVAANIRVQQNEGTTAGFGVAIATALVPTGASGSVVATWDLTAAAMTCAVYGMPGMTNPVPTATAVDNSHNAPTATLNVPQNGAVIAVVTTSTTTTLSANWSNLTGDINQQFSGNQVWTTASAPFATAQVGLAITCTFSGGTPFRTPAAVWAVWGP